LGQRTTRNFDKVEDGWRFGGGSEAPHFFQIDIYQYFTKEFCLRVEDGGRKRKKNSEKYRLRLKHGPQFIIGK
jgi:hypothetical protein